MEENVGRTQRPRNIRTCNKCGISHYGPKDDSCVKILIDRGDGRGELWILPAGLEGGRRRAQRRRVGENLRNNNENGQDAEIDGQDNNDEHLDPNYAANSDNDGEEEPPVAGIPTQNRVWEQHNIREPPRRRNVAEGEPTHGRTKPIYNGLARGPRNIPANVRGPSAFFNLFFDEIVMAHFVEITNIYGRKYYEQWSATTSDELYQLFGVLLYMGIVRQADMRSYWSTKGRKSKLYRRSFVTEKMTGKRFRALLQCLHWEDASELTAEQRTEMNRGDGFWSVNTLLEYLSDLFDHYYQCGQHMDIDEMCIAFKGRHRCRCYNPKKPHKYHLKAYCLNCSETGYLKKFFMYRGKAEVRSAHTTASTFPVFKFIDADPQFHNVNHILGLDNWYTSLELGDLASRLGFHIVGTIKTNRRGLPVEGKFPKSGPNVQPKGTIKIMKTQASDNGYSIYFTAFMDNKPVHLMSTFEPFQAFSFRRSTTNGVYQRILLQLPSIISVYNHAMGGTDLDDQYVAYYEFLHKSNNWQRRIFTHFIFVAARNAHILYQESFRED